MAKEMIAEEKLQQIMAMVPNLIKLTTDKLWIDYDREADVIYINYQKPQQATDSEMLDNGIILRHREDKLVGITILDVSTRI